MPMYEPFTSEPRDINIAGLHIQFGSISLVNGVVKTDAITVGKQQDAESEYTPLFTIESADSNDAGFGVAPNKYSNATDVVRHLHRQVYLNAFESGVTNHSTDRTETMKLLATAAGLLGINVWTSLTNPQETVSGSFEYEWDHTHVQEVRFTRGVIDGNFVTVFDEVFNTTSLFGVHQLVADGEPVNLYGEPPHKTLINSAVKSTKTVITVAGSMYSPRQDAEFREASIDGGVMLTPKEQFKAYQIDGIVSVNVPLPDNIKLIDNDLDNYLLTVKHEATPQVLATLKGDTGEDGQQGNYAQRGLRGVSGPGPGNCGAGCTIHQRCIDNDKQVAGEPDVSDSSTPGDDYEQ